MLEAELAGNTGDDSTGRGSQEALNLMEVSEEEMDVSEENLRKLKEEVRCMYTHMFIHTCNIISMYICFLNVTDIYICTYADTTNDVLYVHVHVHVYVHTFIYIIILVPSHSLPCSLSPSLSRSLTAFSVLPPF